MAQLLNPTISAIKVSSTLGDSAEFNKNHLVDNRDDTCWNSDEGSAQYMVFKFRQPVNLTELAFTFQAGFIPKVMQISVGIAHPDNPAKMLFKQLSTVSIEDSHSEQRFTVDAQHISAIKCDLSNFTDFFGRVIVYHAKFYGSIVDNN